jgi:hypothetical protein
LALSAVGRIPVIRADGPWPDSVPSGEFHQRLTTVEVSVNQALGGLLGPFG